MVLSGKVKNRGFTLIELLVAVSIIGILSAIAITSYIGVTLKATRTEAYSNLESLRLLEEQFFAENACYEPLAGGVCPGGNNNYAGTAAIQGFLPRFQPGAGLSYTYTVTLNMRLTNAGGNTAANPPATAASAVPCFVATATGIAGTRVGGPPADVFAIDCNNNRNF